MLVDGDSTPFADGPVATAEPFRLDAAVTDLYAEHRLAPLLRRLLAHTSRLLNTVAGSISFIESGQGSYAKIAETGASCRLGQSFPLNEGATGYTVARRRPVVIEDYSLLGSGHLPSSHPASRGAVAAVPIWWRGDVIGVNVAFAGRRRRFTAGELDDLELLTQSSAAAIRRAGADHP